ncbi:bromodomain-containing protein DDB_G0280777-like [Tribolium madens]|uniref:bromodomain-containing protein DDB_G0280777-like n=1 Tax=Tribolium madens TaxID=41895 RepID=UPI001CF763FD|nr:bromodomain-containing protein DDB_G0280777-like [Tribolium madens]
MKLTVCLLFVYVTGSFAYPVSQPAYPDTQYISAQAIPAVQYRQQQQQQQQPQAYLQPQYISAPVQTQQAAKPVYETIKSLGLQKFSTQIRQPIQQVLLSTNVDRQIQRVAQQAGPYFLQQIQAAQQQGQAQQALDAAQRKATSQTLSRQIQPLPLPVPQQQPQPQPQPHYLRVVPQPAPIKYQPAPVKYAAPAAPGYRQHIQPQYQQQQQQQQQQQHHEEQQNPEDYDPNPSYQFGFDVNDDLYTNYQNRKEQREGGKTTGSYSVVDSDGFVRTVTYTADPKEGFKAEVTRQPTNIVVKVPKPDPQFQRPPQHYVQSAPVQQKAQAQAQQPNLIQYQYQ